MKVLLVRHAQSQNNIVQARVHTKVQAGVSSEGQAQDEWLCVNPASTRTHHNHRRALALVRAPGAHRVGGACGVRLLH